MPVLPGAAIYTLLPRVRIRLPTAGNICQWSLSDDRNADRYLHHHSFAWFCLPISDYDTFTRKFLWHPFSDVKYAIDTNTVTDRIGEYVSNERIGIGKIVTVLVINTIPRRKSGA